MEIKLEHGGTVDISDDIVAEINKCAERLRSSATPDDTGILWDMRLYVYIDEGHFRIEGLCKDYDGNDICPSVMVHRGYHTGGVRCYLTVRYIDDTFDDDDLSYLIEDSPTGVKDQSEHAG